MSQVIFKIIALKIINVLKLNTITCALKLIRETINFTEHMNRNIL